MGIVEWILGMRDQQWIGFFTRQVMEKCNSFTCAQKMLAKAPLVAPVYFILSGVSSTEVRIFYCGSSFVLFFSFSNQFCFFFVWCAGVHNYPREEKFQYLASWTEAEEATGRLVPCSNQL